MDVLAWFRGDAAEWPTGLSAERFKRRTMRAFRHGGATVEPPTAPYDFLASIGAAKWAVICFAEDRDLTYPVFADLSERQLKTRYRLMLVTARAPSQVALSMADERKMALLHYRDIAARIAGPEPVGTPAQEIG